MDFVLKPVALPIVPQRDIAPAQLKKWLVLHHTHGFGPAKLAMLIEHQIHPLELLGSNQKSLFARISLPETIRRALNEPNWQAIEKAVIWAEQPNCHIIPIVSTWYPQLLREIADPPIVLYAQGDAELLQFPQLAMVGSRNPSHYGQETAFEFARHLSQAGLIITSGMATGIDTHSHQGALAGSGLTIAVAGTGLDSVYPAKNKALAEQIAAQGLLLSEFAMDTKPVAHNFPRRNRVISGLSVGTLVVEAALQSGSLITARQAMEQGREVFAIPGSIHNPLARGCHHLIRQGAKLVETGDDVLQELAPLIATLRRSQNATTPEKSGPPQGLSIMRDGETDSPQHKLLEAMDFEPVSIDILVQRSRLTPETISSMLVELELNGLIVSSGGLYSRL